MNALDILVLLAAFVSVAAYLCRLDSLKFGTHTAPIVIFHICLCAASILAGHHAWSGETDALDVFVLAGALAWIWLSLPTWGRGSVPPQFETRPTPLDEVPR